MKRQHTSSQNGQTLLEIVFAVGVVAIIITALVVAGTSSLRYGQESRLRSAGVKYAQGALELAREIRDTHTWDVFLAYSGTGSQTWCVDAAGAWTQDDGSGCDQIETGSPFSRSVTFTWNDPLMSVVSRVSWRAGSTELSTQLQTYLTQWRQ